MTTIVTRTETQTDGTAPKGSELTWSEVDTNFINLNDNKVEVSGAIIFAAKAGEALSKGDVVHVSGVSGNQPVVSKADADDAAKMPAFGLAEADANLNAAVNVVTFGTLYDLDTSAFSAGDTVYVSTTAGGLTATKPTGESSLIQNLGLVIRSHASAGSIKVGGAGRSNDTPNLNDGNVFIGNASNQVETRALVEADISDLQAYLTSVSVSGLSDATITSVADNEVLAYDSASSEWINQTAAEAGLATSAQGSLADSALQPADLSVTTNAAGTAALTYTSGTGVFSYTPPDLSSYLTSYTETDTLDSVTGRGATTTNAVTVGNLTSTGIDDNATSTALTITDSGIAATLTTAAQPNITSVGTLTGFTSTGIDDNATSTAITIDSSQNVGIGDGTISATLDLHSTTASRTLSVEGSGGKWVSITSGTGTTGPMLVFDDTSSRFRIASGSDKLGSGVTERFVVEPSGNVGIGIASPATGLHLGSSTTFSTFRLTNSATTGSGFDVLTSGDIGYVYNRNNSSLIFGTNNTDRAVITSSGDVGIGQTSPDTGANYTTLHIGDSAASPDNARIIMEGSSRKFGLYAFQNNWGIYDYTASANRLVIEDGGEVAIGASTAGTSKFYVQGAGTSNSLRSFTVQNSAGTDTFFVRDDGLIRTGTATNSPYNLTTFSSANLVVSANGTLYRSTSSARYKRNIQDMTYGVADVMNLRAVTFEHKNEYPSNTYAGFIAEEVHDAGLTEFVEYNDAGQPDAVHYANMVSLLTKAIQEQQATIASLTARIEQLEAN